MRLSGLGALFLFCVCWLCACGHSQRAREVKTTAGSQTPAASTGATPAKPKSDIRKVDLTTFVKAHLGEINPGLADLQTDCGEGQPPVTSMAPPEYGDVDSDGEEEAAIVGFSCLSGTGGADFVGVLKLSSDGRLIVLPMEPLPKTFKGRDVLKDLRGHQTLRIRDGRLMHVLPIYAGGEPNCCPEGGERHFLYRWDGHKFVVDDIMDLPAEKSGS